MSYLTEALKHITSAKSRLSYDDPLLSLKQEFMTEIETQVRTGLLPTSNLRTLSMIVHNVAGTDDVRIVMDRLEALRSGRTKGLNVETTLLYNTMFSDDRAHATQVVIDTVEDLHKFIRSTTESKTFTEKMLELTRINNIDEFAYETSTVDESANSINFESVAQVVSNAQAAIPEASNYAMQELAKNLISYAINVITALGDTADRELIESIANAYTSSSEYDQSKQLVETLINLLNVILETYA